MAHRIDDIRLTEAAALRTGSSSFSPLSFLRRCFAVLLEWRQNYEARCALAELPEHMLKDIGLTRGDVEAEAARPSWKPIDYTHLELRRRSNEREWRRFGSA